MKITRRVTITCVLEETLEEGGPHNLFPVNPVSWKARPVQLFVEQYFDAITVWGYPEFSVLSDVIEEEI